MELLPLKEDLFNITKNLAYIHQSLKLKYLSYTQALIGAAALSYMYFTDSTWQVISTNAGCLNDCSSPEEPTEYPCTGMGTGFPSGFKIRI